MNASFLFNSDLFAQITINPLNFWKRTKKNKFFSGCNITTGNGANFQKKVIIWLYSLAEILHRHPEGNIALVEIQWLPPFHGIFQNLKKIKYLLKFIESYTYVTLQKKEVCAQFFVPVKHFKICYVFVKRKPMKFFLFSFWASLSFTLWMPCSMST